MKKLLFVLLAMFMAVSAVAGSISRGGGSFGGARSFSSPGRSMGMSRPSITPSAPRSTAPSASVPHYSPPSYTPAPSYHAPPAGGGFLSSFGGSFFGSWLGSSMGSSHAGTTVVNGSGTSSEYGPVIASAPAASSSSWFWQFVLLLLALAITALVIWASVAIVRSIRQSKMQDNPSSLPFSPVSRFLEVQRAFAARDAAALRGLLGPDMVDQVLADMPAEVYAAQLANISYTVLDASGDTVSVRFRADDPLDNTKLDETWHFVRAGGAWKLNGIEQ